MVAPPPAFAPRGTLDGRVGERAMGHLDSGSGLRPTWPKAVGYQVHRRVRHQSSRSSPAGREAWAAARCQTETHPERRGGGLGGGRVGSVGRPCPGSPWPSERPGYRWPVLVSREAPARGVTRHPLGAHLLFSVQTSVPWTVGRGRCLGCGVATARRPAGSPRHGGPIHEVRPWKPPTHTRGPLVSQRECERRCSLPGAGGNPGRDPGRESGQLPPRCFPHQAPAVGEGRLPLAGGRLGPPPSTLPSLLAPEPPGHPLMLQGSLHPLSVQSSTVTQPAAGHTWEQHLPPSPLCVPSGPMGHPRHLWIPSPFPHPCCLRHRSGVTPCRSPPSTVPTATFLVLSAPCSSFFSGSLSPSGVTPPPPQCTAPGPCVWLGWPQAARALVQPPAPTLLGCGEAVFPKVFCF